MSKFEAGFYEILDPESDTPHLRAPTAQCVHCGSHFPEPNFGNDAMSRKNRIGRGWCHRCGGFICGEKCMECVPQEAMLEIMEGTKNPTAVSVGMNGQGSKLWLPE